MIGTVRRHAIQFAGAAVMILLVGILATLASCSGGGTANTPTVTPVATPTPTPNHDEADVKAAVEKLVAAWLKSDVTGSATELNALVVPDSLGLTDLLAGVDIAHDTHKTVAITQSSLSAWSIDATGDEANVAVTVTAVGHDATWPQLTRLSADRDIPVLHLHLVLRKEGSQWLDADFTE